MKVALGVICFFLATVGAVEVQSDRVELAQFLLLEHMQMTQIPGAQVAVWQDGELVWSKAYGLADIENQQAMSTSTPMRIASVSKSITAVAMMRLVEQGLLDLDAPAHRYLHELPDHLGGITARQLASSSSGIRHYNDSDVSNKAYFATSLDALERFDSDDLLFPPGTQFEYSSYGWVLLSAMIEAIVDAPFAVWMSAQFPQMGLQNTYLDHPEFAASKLSTQYVLSQPVWWKRLFFNASELRQPVQWEDRSYMFAGGGMVSTAEQLAIFGGRLLTDDLLTQSSKEIMWRDCCLSHSPLASYALGWELSENEPYGRVLYHSGSMSSARSHLLLFPSQNTSVAILYNTGQHVFFNESEAFTIASIFLNSETPSVSPAILGEWDICTTSLRDRDTCGTLRIQTQGELVTGFIEFKRSQENIRMPMALVQSVDGSAHFVAVSPMFMRIELKIEGDKLEGRWWHELSLHPQGPVDEYWRPRALEGTR